MYKRKEIAGTCSHPGCIRPATRFDCQKPLCRRHVSCALVERMDGAAILGILIRAFEIEAHELARVILQLQSEHERGAYLAAVCVDHSTTRTGKRGRPCLDPGGVL